MYILYSTREYSNLMQVDGVRIYFSSTVIRTRVTRALQINTSVPIAFGNNSKEPLAKSSDAPRDGVQGASIWRWSRTPL